MANNNGSAALFFLGRRVERLFMGGVLIILISIAEAYLSSAASQFSQDRSTNTITALINRFALEQSPLTAIFTAKPETVSPPLPPVGAEIYTSQAARARVEETRKKLGLPPPIPPEPRKKPKLAPKPITYAEAVNRLIDDLATHLKLSKDELSKLVDTKKSPQDIIDHLLNEKNILESKPVTVWGLQTPRFLQVQYAGLDYKLPYNFLSTALALALGPLIFGWLGAVYMTRQRELMNIALIDDYKLAFPHLINILPVHFYSLEKRLHINKKIQGRNFSRILNRLSCSFARSVVILLFTAPMLWGFIYSIFQLWTIEGEVFTAPIFASTLILLIIIFELFILVIQEWTIMHGKEFIES